MQIVFYLSRFFPKNVSCLLFPLVQPGVPAVTQDLRVQILAFS